MAGRHSIRRNRGGILFAGGSLAGSLLLAALLALFISPAHAATTVITVTGTGDTATPASCAPSFSCATLRDAVTTANTLTSSSASPVEIDLPAGTITLSHGILTILSGTNLNTTIKGHTAGVPSDTIIDQTTANAGVFITPGTTSNQVVNFSDLTIEGGHAGGFGGGALQAGSAANGVTGNASTFTDCVLLNNSATKGGAIVMASGGNLTITNSTFTGNSATAGTGGAIDFFTDGAHGTSNLQISGSTFTNNSISGIVNGGANGGAVFYSGASTASLTISTSVFTGNTAGSATGADGKGGALLISDVTGHSDSVTLATFVNNTAHDGAVTNTIPQGQGGGVWSNGGTLTLSDSRLVGNTATDGPSFWQDTSGGSADVSNNWWGVNTGPGANSGGGASAVITTSPWLELRNVPTTANLHPGGVTTLTADILGRNTGGPLAAGTLNGLASFPSPAGTVFTNAVHGTLSGSSTQFVNGVATSSFTGSSTLLGPASADATADSQTVTADMSIKADTTTGVSSSTNPSVFGQGVTFTATITSNTPGTTPAAPQGGTVQFGADGANLGAPVAVASATAKLSFTSLSVGTHTITATYSGDADFNGSSGTLAGGQTVNKADTAVALGSTPNPSIIGGSVQFTATVTAVAPGAGTPGGVVQFFDGVTPIGSGTASGGVASISTSSLAVGTHSVTATYGGDANFNGSSGGPLSQVVLRAPTTVSLSSSANPSVFGQGVTFTAAVSSTHAGSISGSVQFGIDGANVGLPATVSGGSATLPNLSTLAVGTHTVTATYSGDATFAPSSGTLAGGQTVNKANSATALGSSKNPSNIGDAVDFTATVTVVAPGSGTLTGNVQFSIDGSNFGSPQAMNGSGVATLSGISSLAIGTHPVTATYLGNPGFNASTSATLDQVVTGKATTTTVTSSVNPSVFGQPVTFTATVDSGGNGTPVGSVQFGVDGANVGSPVALDGSGVAVSPAISSLAVGVHTVTATFGAGSGFAASSGTLAGGQTVNHAGTTTVVSSSANPSAFGQPVSFTATVAPVSPGAGTPTGQVQFFVDGSAFGTPATLAGGAASSGSTSSLAVGSHPVTATYSGGPDFSASTSAAIVQVVGQLDATINLNSTVNPSVFGQAVQFTATLSGAGGTPTGMVQFGVDGSNLGGPVSLASGTATSTATTTLAVGPHTVTATYGGDAVYRPVTGTITHTVSPASTTTGVASSQNPSVFGQPVSFTATVSPVAPGAGTPTGQVQFVIDGSNFGNPVTLTGGIGTSTVTSTLPPGSHAVRANYLGDGNFAVSSGMLAGGQTVNPAGTTTGVASSQNPSVFGQPVSFTATVSPVAPGAGTPAGQVQFGIDGANVGSPVALDGSGVAVTPAINTLAVGTHTVTATYTGDGNHSASSGTLAGGQTVNQAGTTTTVTSSQNPSIVGNPVTFTAAVSPLAPGAGTPAGSVQFVVDGTNAGGPVALSGGTAVYTTSTLTIGTHSVTANYGGSTNFQGSSGSLAGGQVVNPAGVADLSVMKVGPRSAVVGVPSMYTLLVTNRGPDAATGVQLTDTLPAGWTVVSVVTTQGSCSVSLPAVQCSLGTIPKNGHAVVIVVAVPHAAGTVTNTATVVSPNQRDPNPADNTSKLTIVVRPF